MKYIVEIHETVKCVITLEVKAPTLKDAAQLARDLWVLNGSGEKHEEVQDRWAEIGGEEVELENNS